MFPPLPEPTESVSQISFEPVKDPDEIVETLDGCELELMHFFAGRNLVNQRALDEEQRKIHDEKYENELFYDAKDAAEKGKIMLKKYRKDNINEQSNCDSQYVNNLHTYYGDGSKLKPIPKQHYAMDFIDPHCNDTEDQTKLKNLEVLRSKKSVANWVEKHRKLGFIKSIRRRSQSCHDFKLETPPETHLTTPKPRFTYDKNATIYSVDGEIERYKESIKILQWNLKSSICNAVNCLITRVNAFEHPNGRMEIGKVLFATDKGMVYVIPKKFDTMILLREFSQYFTNWLKTLPPDQKMTFGTEHDDSFKDKFKGSARPSRPYYSQVNVILCLSEFEQEGTMFRRARHVCRVPNTYNDDIYFEIDTGMLRVVKTNEKTVRRMPQWFAHVPTPILEVRFEGVEKQEEVEERIEEIRRTGFMYISRFDTGDRSKEQKSNYKGRNTIRWCDLETAVVLPPKPRPPTLLTTLFCGETYCMGLCCTGKYLEKSEISPSTMSVPSAWVADKREAKRFFPEKEQKTFKYVPPASGYKPRTNRIYAPSASNSCQPPTDSRLKAEDVSDFFK